MADNFIDLGRESMGPGCCESTDSKKPEVYYPSLYINGVEGLDLSTGDVTFTAKGRVVSVSHRETEEDGEKWSCEIEVHSIKFPGMKPEVDDSEDSADSRLGKALDKLASKKMDDMGDE